MTAEDVTAEEGTTTLVRSVDGTTVLVKSVDGCALGVAEGVDEGMMDDVAFGDDERAIEDATEGATACDDSGAEDTTGVSDAADDGDGRTVVYCVTITGGTWSDVEGRTSAEGDAATDDWGEEDTGTAGVGKTVVYSVLVTTRRDEVVIVVLSGARLAGPEASSDELTGTALVELATALLRVAVPWDAPGWVNPGMPVPF